MPSPDYPLRYATFYLTTLANASEQDFECKDTDIYRVRHLKNIFAGIATAGVTLYVKTKGQLYLSIDCTRFAAGDNIVPIDVDVMEKQSVFIGLQNAAGAALTAVPIVYGYTVDPGTGP